jgi:hypothetical protein
MPNPKAVTKDELRAEIVDRRFWVNQMAALLTQFACEYPKHPSARSMQSLVRYWEDIGRRPTHSGSREVGDGG